MLCMGLPMFMYQVVLEKEMKLVEYMKINGLTMANYWTVMFLFNYGYYLISATLFYLFGKYVLGMLVFKATHPLLMFVVMNGWGLAQIS